MLDYALEDLDGAGLADGPADPRHPDSPPEGERVVGPAAPVRHDEPAVPVRRARIWTLSVDAGVIADSNVTNGSDLREIELDTGGQALPVTLDPRLREKAGIGFGISASAGVKLPAGKNVALTADAEAYGLDYAGGASDDFSVLAAAGVELSPGAGAQAAIQLTAFERWYGGVSANAGFGLRGHFRQPTGAGGSVSLDVDARVFDSDYGEDFGGRQASVYLAYQRPLASDLSGSLGVFARREWLEADSYSSLELGIYGGLSRYLTSDLTASLSGGLSRLRFDGPILFLSPDPRRDWHAYASLHLTTRRPLAWGFWPSMTYTYNRTDSNIAFYRSDRHRMRLGLLRRF